MAKNQRSVMGRILIAIVVVALIGGAAEIALRLIIPGVVSAQVRESLQLTDDHPVDTTLGGSVVLRALTGRVGDLTISVDGVPAASGIVADLTAHADSAPFNVSAGEIAGGTARITISDEQLGPVVALLTRGVAQTGRIDAGDLIVGRSFEILGQSFPLEVRLAVAVDNGDVLLRPNSVEVVGLGLSAEQVSAATGTLLDPILRPEPVCVRSAIPEGITLTDVSFSSTGNVSVDMRLSPGILSDPSQREPGSCG